MPGIRHVLTVAAGVVAAAAAPAAASPAATAPTRPAPRPVHLQAADFRFCPATATTCVPERDDAQVTTVPVGTTVTWSYADHACDVVAPCPGHNVVFAKGGGATRLVKSDGALILRMRFTRTGRYAYFCTAHQSFGMTGTIVVTKR